MDSCCCSTCRPSGAADCASRDVEANGAGTPGFTDSSASPGNGRTALFRPVGDEPALAVLVCHGARRCGSLSFLLAVECRVDARARKLSDPDRATIREFPPSCWMVG